MEISLIRHGRSTCTENNRIKCTEFKDWVEKYDGNGVFEEKAYPTNTLERIVAANIIITSDVNLPTT